MSAYLKIPGYPLLNAGVIALSLACAGPALAQAPATTPATPPAAPRAAPALPAGVIARIDGAAITEEDLKIALEELGPTLPRQMGDAEKRAYAIDYLVDLKIVANQARKEKLDDTADFKRRLDQTRDRLLMEALMTREAEKGVTEAQMKAFYDETVKGLPAQEEARARHILVEKEEEAKAILDRIKKGEDFAKLATELSKDPGSGAQGGDLGWFEKERMVPEFAEAAFKLNKGQVSDIVKSQFGFHIIRLDDKRPKAPPAFDAVKEQLRRYMVQKAQQDYVLKLREGVKVER